MKNFVMVLVLFAFSCSAYGYEERIERDGDQLRGAWTSSQFSPTSVGVPVAGNFYAYSGTFVSQDLSCDDFGKKVHALISDWNGYHDLNLYALTICTVPAGAKSSTDFIYAIDAWVADAVPADQAFLKDHQGMQFQGQSLDFYAVTSIDVKTVLSLGKLTGNALKVVHDASYMNTFSGTNVWYPDYYNRSLLIQKTDGKVFFDFVGDKFGADETAAFQQALSNSNFVQFSDFFTLHLESGQTADFWLGFGSSRSCGTQPCFTSP